MGTVVKLIENGPIIVRGIEETPLVEVHLEGGEIQSGKSFAICRCGLSDRMPFCDGAHSKRPPVRVPE